MASGIPTYGILPLFMGPDIGNIHGLNEYMGVQSLLDRARVPLRSREDLLHAEVAALLRWARETPHDVVAAMFAAIAVAAPPHLEKQGATQQLIVDGKPFLILGGELGNSSASSAEYMSRIGRA